MMKERPIIMSAPMVRAILGGHKTQTRRVLKLDHDAELRLQLSDGQPIDVMTGKITCPHGQVCDRLWIRETWREAGSLMTADNSIPESGTTDAVVYAADGQFDGPWRPSIFMPRWASRLTLEIVNVRVERLQEITEEDAKAEGITVQTGHLWRPLGSKEPMRKYTHRQAFGALWNSINAKRGYGWSINPWVWVIEFKRVGRT